MSRYDLIIRGGSIVVPSGVQRADIGVIDGKIAEIAPDLEGSHGEELRAVGLHIFPGVVDAHLHFNEPGRTEWEGFATGSRALAAGGGTTFFDMPLNAHPPTLDASSFRAKLSAAEASSFVDFGLWGGLVPGNKGSMEELAELGVVGFKAFMSNSGIDDFRAVDDLTLYEGMVEAARLGCLVAVHAESEAITSLLAQRALHDGRTTARDFAASRPVIAELEAIERAILFAEEAGCALHIVHVSSGRGVALVARARMRGVDVSCETCPHYLVLTEDDMEEIGAIAKCAPPLRPREEQDALWQHILEGTLPMVVSDHSPSPPDMKAGVDYFRAWGGISGCQSLLALLLTEGYTRRQIPLSLIASLIAGFTSRRFGIDKQKGALEVGRDADFAMVDLNAKAVLASDDLLYRHKQSPYVGMTMQGRVVRTIVRGMTIFAYGRAPSEPVGQLVRPDRTIK